MPQADRRWVSVEECLDALIELNNENALVYISDVLYKKLVEKFYCCNEGVSIISMVGSSNNIIPVIVETSGEWHKVILAGNSKPKSHELIVFLEYKRMLETNTVSVKSFEELYNLLNDFERSKKKEQWIYISSALMSKIMKCDFDHGNHYKLRNLIVPEGSEPLFMYEPIDESWFRRIMINSRYSDEPVHPTRITYIVCDEEFEM